MVDRRNEKMKKKKIQKVEIARSFAFKYNAGNYQSADFFCSQKSECSPKDADKISEALYQFCKQQVLNAVNEYKKELNPATSAKPPKHPWGDEDPPGWCNTDKKLNAWLFKQ